mmetsp:Transcript_25434/g.40680  ORF Transcript_25434/g.40680 Transcript_25434/m.40680 type:complete len:153 (-) Transcript_25434:569-1027(-)
MLIVVGTVVGVVLLAAACGAYYARCASRAQTEARETGVHHWSPNLLGGPNPMRAPPHPPHVVQTGSYGQQNTYSPQQQQQQYLPQQQYPPHPQQQYPPPQYQQYPPPQYPPLQYYSGGGVAHGQPAQGLPVAGPEPPVQHFQATVQAPQMPK